MAYDKNMKTNTNIKITKKQIQGVRKIVEILTSTNAKEFVDLSGRVWTKKKAKSILLDMEFINNF